MTDRDAMQQALAVLEMASLAFGHPDNVRKCDAAIASLQSRLSEPEPAHWFFQSSEPLGTILAIEPDGTRHIVKRGDMNSVSGRALLEAMTRALATPPTEPAAAPAGQPEAGIVGVTINGHQLRQALEFLNPDGDKDRDQLDSELNLEHCPIRTSVDGELMQAGLYAWFTDYPEEGCVLLSDEAVAPHPSAEPAAAPQSGPSASGLVWQDAPTTTGWGAGMKVATVALSKDATADIYAHEDDLALVPGALAASQATEQPKAPECANHCQQAVDYGVWPEAACKPSCVYLNRPATEQPAALAALQARLDEAEKLLASIATALPVLRVMCETAGLNLGATKATEMQGWVSAHLAASKKESGHA